MVERNQAGVRHTRSGEVLRPGDGETLLDAELAAALRTLAATAGEGQSRSVMIDHPVFHVEMKGVDPRAIDARGLVQALLPELRQAIRRGELELDTETV